MPWKPRAWLAALLALIAPPLGLLYARRPFWAVAYLPIGLLFAVLQFWLFATGRPWPILLPLFVGIMAHAWFAAARSAPGAKPWYARWYGLAGTLLVLFLALLLLRGFAYEPFNVPSGSMFPNVRKGASVITQKSGYGHYSAFGIPLWSGPVSEPLQRGEMFVFENPNQRDVKFIKRLIGLPGDRLKYWNKRLSINGREFSYASAGESAGLQLRVEGAYRIAIQLGHDDGDFELTVPPGKVFFMGDERDNSLDSRHFGPVPFDHLVGRVVLVLQPEEFPAARI